MTSPVQCTQCQHSFGVPADSAGKKVRCPSCEEPQRILTGVDGKLSLAILEGPKTGSKPIAAVPSKGAAPSDQAPEGETAVFLLGILGFFMCPFLGIFGLSVWNSYAKKCEAAGVEPSGLAQAGRILSIICVGILVLSLLAFFVMLLFIPLAASVG